MTYGTIQEQIEALDREGMLLANRMGNELGRTRAELEDVIQGLKNLANDQDTALLSMSRRIDELEDNTASLDRIMTIEERIANLEAK